MPDIWQHIAVKWINRDIGPLIPKSYTLVIITGPNLHRLLVKEYQ
jgi:hypothetical protein